MTELNAVVDDDHRDHPGQDRARHEKGRRYETSMLCHERIRQRLRPGAGEPWRARRQRPGRVKAVGSGV